MLNNVVVSRLLLNVNVCDWCVLRVVLDVCFAMYWLCIVACCWYLFIGCCYDCCVMLLFVVVVVCF